MKYTVYAKSTKNWQMVEFCFYMPIQYEGLVIEHEHVRKAVGDLMFCTWAKFM